MSSAVKCLDSQDTLLLTAGHPIQTKNTRITTLPTTELKAAHPNDVEFIGFPCNQFGSQEKGDDAEIATFCTKNHGVTFPLMKVRYLS